MSSREEITEWLCDGTNEILNTYRHMPKKTREAIVVQQIIDKMRNRAAKVENMRCENCNFWDCYSAYSKTTGRCLMLGFSRNADFGCFSFESKEDSNNE